MKNSFLPRWAADCAALLFLAAVLLMPGPGGVACAQFVNGGFESPRQSPGVPNFDLLLDSAVPGWQTTASDSLIEIWSDGFDNAGGEPPVFSYEGFQHAELNATEFSTLFQDVTGIAANAKIGFEFAHRGRLGEDTMRLTITDLGADNVPGGGNDTVLFTKTYTDGTNAWGFHTSAGEPTITALGNTVRFAYEAVSAAGGDPAIGNFIDACSFGVGVNVPCEFDFANRLIGYWPFDETNGLAAADASGFGNNGALNNFSGNAQWVPGRVGGALTFDGASQYVRVPDYPKQISRTMSVAAWVWADAHTAWGTIIKNWGGTIPDQFHLGQTDTAGDISMFLQESDAGQVNIRENTPLPLGRWEHVVFVADGANMTLCRNGVLVAGPVPYDGTITNPPVMGALGIGAKLDNAGNVPPIPIENPGFWDGKLDEVALWSRPLSACECKALYEAGLAGKNLFDPTITDTTPPTIVCSNLTIGTAFGCEGFPIYNVTATDDCNAVTVICVPPEGFAFPVGTTNVTCTATDECGNSNSCSFTLTVRDTTPPQITTCPAARSIPGDPATCAGVTPNLVGEVVAMDNCSAPGALVITQSPAAGTPAVGLTPVVTISVRDPAGNTGTCTVQLTLNFPPPICTMNFANGLIGYWPFDENSGLTAADASGNGNNGALNNFSGNAQWVPGRVGGALNFGGPNSQQYVRVPDYPKTITSTMTVAAWVWADAHTPWGTIIKNWGGTVPGQFHLGQTSSDGDISMFLQESDAGQVNIRENTALPLGRWEHVVFTADGVNMWLCRNGVVVAGPVPYDGTVFNPPAMGSLGIGGKLDNAGNVPPILIENPGFWQGKLDEVALWNRALSPCECKALYEAGLAGTNLLSPTIRDTTPPVLVCTNMTVPEECGLCCFANVTYELLATDTCGKPTVVCVPPSGSFFNVGTAPVNCTATDACGNTASCTFTVTVVSTNDVSPPFMQCFAEFSIDADPFTCTATMPDFFNNLLVTDNGCTLPDRIIRTQTPPAGTVLSNGLHNVTFIATDLSGNSSTCQFVLNVSFERTCEMDFSYSLLGYWPFDETEGLTTADMSGNSTGGSLSNYTGNAQWGPGQVGGALSFGGPASQQFVRVQEFASWGVYSTLSAAAWVWADAHTPWATVVKQWGSTIPGQFHLGLWDMAGDMSMVIQEADAGQVIIRENTLLPTGRWEHIAFVADGANMWLCRNGVLVAGPVPYDGTITNTSQIFGGQLVVGSPLGIGAKLDDAGDGPAAINPGFWQGKLDEVAIWGRALSRCEVVALYEAGLAGRNLLDPSIRDATPPSIACPANINTNAAVDSCSRVVAFDVAATDACSKAIVACAPPSGHAFPVGVTTVNCSARDVCGNTNYCSFTVTVTGGALHIACPPPQTAFANCALIPVPDFTATAIVTGGCPPGGPFTLTQTPAAGTLVSNGVHAVMLVVSNAAGNFNSCLTAFHVNLDPPCIALFTKTNELPVLWVPLDEASGSSARNLVTGAPHGTHNGSPASLPGANVLGALHFDGVDDSVTVHNYSAISKQSTGHSVEAWILRDPGSTGRRVIVSKVTPGLRGYEFYLDNGVLQLDLHFNGVLTTFSSLATVPDNGQWHHVAAVEREAQYVDLYLDGARVRRITITSSFRPAFSPANLLIGASSFPTPNSFFKGGIDEVAVYDRYIDAASIAAIFAAGRSGRCRIDCFLVWDKGFPSTNAGAATFFLPITIMNNTATPETITWTASGPLSFLPPNSGVVTVPPFSSRIEQFEVFPPLQRVTLYFVTLRSSNRCPMVCEGKLVYTYGVVPTVPTFVVQVPGLNGFLIPITLSNVPTCRTITLQPIDPSMAPATGGISLNGQPPGPITINTPCPGAFIPAGEGGGGRTNFTFNLNVQFVETQVNARYSILVDMDVDNDGTPETMASFDVENTVVPPPSIRIVTVGNQRQLHWDDGGDGLGVLECASTVTGPWAPVPNAAPGYVLPTSGGPFFYRLAVP